MCIKITFSLSIYLFGGLEDVVIIRNHVSRFPCNLLYFFSRICLQKQLLYLSGRWSNQTWDNEFYYSKFSFDFVNLIFYFSSDRSLCFSGIFLRIFFWFEVSTIYNGIKFLEVSTLYKGDIYEVPLLTNSKQIDLRSKNVHILL